MKDQAFRYMGRDQEIVPEKINNRKVKRLSRKQPGLFDMR